MPEARRAAPSSAVASGWSPGGLRDSSSSQPGEDRTGGWRVYRAIVPSLARRGRHWRSRSGARLIAQTDVIDRPRWNPSALGLPECQERNYTRRNVIAPATGPAPDPRDGRERTRRTFVTQKQERQCRLPLSPLEDRIVIRQVEASTTASGLVIPDTAKEKPQEGEVDRRGPGRVDGQVANRGLVDVKVGDVVIPSAPRH